MVIYGLAEGQINYRPKVKYTCIWSPFSRDIFLFVTMA